MTLYDLFFVVWMAVGGLVVLLLSAIKKDKND
jgi:hypothetical protein